MSQCHVEDLNLTRTRAKGQEAPVGGEGARHLGRMAAILLCLCRNAQEFPAVIKVDHDDVCAVVAGKAGACDPDEPRVGAVRHHLLGGAGVWRPPHDAAVDPLRPARPSFPLEARDQG